MTRRLSYLLAAILIVSTHRAMSQDFKVPEGYKFKSQADYSRYERDILRCIDFLETAPMDHDGRKPANGFLLQWLAGTARVTISIQSYVLGLVEENKDLLGVYLGGWIRLALQSPTVKDPIEYHLATVRSVLKAYQHCAEIEQDDALDELVTLEKDGKLREWVVEQVGAK